jgi:hypothetical protein
MVVPPKTSDLLAGLRASWASVAWTLVADGWLSATGPALGAITFVGALLASMPGRAWVDNGAAIVVAVSAAVVGVAEIRREEVDLEAD